MPTPRPAALAACLALHAAACAPKPPAPPPPRAETRPEPRPEPAIAYRGVNLAGAEFGADRWGGGRLPGVHGVDYVYPDPAYAAGYDSATYYLGKGANAFRVAFRWERLQPARRAGLDAAELARLERTVGRLTAQGALVILNLHNFGRYRGAPVGSAEVPDADLADVWARLALAFKADPKVAFGLMNEPHDMPTEQWVSAANAAIAAIRGAGAENLILVPGNDYSGAHSWHKSSYGTPNAVAMLQIVDPLDRYAVEVHQYLDADFSGTSAECVGPTVGSESVRGFTAWLRAHRKKGFVAEIGAGPGPTCLRALGDLLEHLEQNADVYLGWAYWAGGPWWGDYFMSLEPAGAADKPQMTALEPHFAPGRRARARRDARAPSP
ncbi:MAG TPA: glycoside hydrolase family 5 protein [Polyangiaceae bacterium]|nr:glycoside hydrolase family 5 protein [Polyangiaceae bacterium]